MAREAVWRKHRRNHTKIRAAERYMMRLTNQDLTNIVGMIRKGSALSGFRITSGKSVFLVSYQDTEMIVLYSKRHQEIITVLPENHRFAERLRAVETEAA